jgi:hypothetical protein
VRGDSELDRPDSGGSRCDSEHWTRTRVDLPESSRGSAMSTGLLTISGNAPENREVRKTAIGDNPVDAVV